MTLATRFGLFGDIHGQAQTLATVLRFLAEAQPPLDALLCTGDLPEKGNAMSLDSARPASTCARLLQEHQVLTVRGNHDRYFVENAADSLLQELFPEEWEASADALAYARILPPTRTLETAMGTLLLCHGVGTRDTEGIFPGGDDAPVAEALAARGIAAPAVRLVAAGHTHRRLCRTVAGITLVNPGTLLRERSGPGFAILDTAREEVQFYDISPATGTITPAEHGML